MHESQRPIPRLVLGENGQLCSQRIDLGAELTTAPQRGIHILTTHRRHLTWLTFRVLAWLRMVDLLFCVRIRRNLNTKAGP